MPNLLLFMTPGAGLDTWAKNGTLERELKPYVHLTQCGWHIKILTFGKGPLPQLPEKIEAVKFSHYRWLWLFPWTHRSLAHWADLLKTNQTWASYYCVWVAQQWRKPILLRGGFIQGEFYETTRKKTVLVSIYQQMERWAFQNTTQCQISTRSLAEWLTTRYGIASEKITVIPNYVDCGLFKPDPAIPQTAKSVLAVGRLDKVKRLDVLLRACAGIPDCRVTLVGEGPDRAALAELARGLKLAVDFTGNKPNDQLPDIIRRHQVYAITSKREGHSKSLIEAMACGAAPVVAKGPGLSSAIRHRTDGLLVEPDEVSIRNAIAELLNNSGLRQSLGEAARKVIVDNYAQEFIFQKEEALLRSLLIP